MPLFLLTAAIGITAVAVILLFWRYADRRVKDAYSDVPPEELEKKLEQALAQQQHLVSRVEHLEAIVASEPWNTSQAHTAPPLGLPGDEADIPPEERAGRRQRSR